MRGRSNGRQPELGVRSLRIRPPDSSTVLIFPLTVGDVMLGSASRLALFPLTALISIGAMNVARANTHVPLQVGGWQAYGETADNGTPMCGIGTGTQGGSQIVVTFEFYKSHIKSIRASRSRQTTYEYLQWLANRWTVRRPRMFQKIFESLTGRPGGRVSQ